ncbi:MAG TPA: hypothetical protein VFW65_18660 [Pseudonocardiaceae bacterium]|nr:hypothetical protein [Pseudonocardiaceae bacterium]
MLTDPASVVYLVVITLCLPPAAYLLPSDPAVVRLRDRVRHRQLRRWVRRQRSLR